MEQIIGNWISVVNEIQRFGQNPHMVVDASISIRRPLRLQKGSNRSRARSNGLPPIATAILAVHLAG